MNKAVNFLQRNIIDPLRTDVRMTQGVQKFASMKFLVAALMYVLAFVLIMRDPFFKDCGVFHYTQGTTVIFLTYIIIATVHWEWQFFGKPQGANLVLHFMQIAPAYMLLARMAGKSSRRDFSFSFGGFLKDLVQTLDAYMFQLNKIIPLWIQDIFQNWKITLLLMFILIIFSISYRHFRLKSGMFMTVLVILLISSFVDSFSCMFLLSMICFSVGLFLQYARRDKYIYYENVLHSLQRQKEIDKFPLETILDFSRQLKENESIDRMSVLRTVERHMKTHFPEYVNDEKAINLFANEIAQQMVLDYHIAKMEMGSNGWQMKANPVLFSEPGNFLSTCATAPRAIFAILIALIWIISPFDFIPDTIPFFGVLDDVAIAILSGFACQTAVQSLRFQKESSSAQKL